ncbi:MAG: acyltransferase family protein, partial [Candidatus Thorarchaeota archaeon]
AIQFWERVSIPVFLVIMGFNAANSFKHRGAKSLGEMVSHGYLQRKTRRYVLPFVLLYLIFIGLGFLSYAIGLTLFSSMAFIPFWGPGIWFVPVVLTAVVVLPILYRAYIWNPRVTIVLCFAIDLLAQIALYVLLQGAAANPAMQDALKFLFQTNILFYASAVAMGIWFSDGLELDLKRNRFVWVLLPISLVYLILYQFFSIRFAFITSDYNLFAFPYSAFLFLLGMRFLPTESQRLLANVATRVGKATYHILMTQILYFSVMFQIFPGISQIGFGTNVAFYVSYYITNITLCFLGGILWYELEQRLGRPRPPMSTAC